MVRSVTRRSIKTAGLTLIACALAVPGALGSTGRAKPVKERIDGARAVVVAKAHAVEPEWRQTSRGDRLIVSRVLLDVEETIKGAHADVRWLEVEGGTLDGVTLHVSDLPAVAAGDRAVFFLDGTSSAHTPHLRGQGILKLDDR